MQIPIQITVRDMAHSSKLDEYIRDKAARLDQFRVPITSCRVVVEAPHKHRHQGRQYNVRVDVTVPGREIVINHEQDEDAYVALRDAFDAARRRLEDYARVRRGEARNRQIGSRRRGTEQAEASDEEIG